MQLTELVSSTLLGCNDWYQHGLFSIHFGLKEVLLLASAIRVVCSCWYSNFYRCTLILRKILILLSISDIPKHQLMCATDFRSYARPSRLLPASEVNLYTKTSVENASSSLKEDRSKSLFRVKLGTSNLYGSGISDSNAGVLLCLIDEDGNSILQRIPVSLMMDHSAESRDILHFQRGSVDEFVFEGPKISRLKALWISVESGMLLLFIWF